MSGSLSMTSIQSQEPRVYKVIFFVAILNSFVKTDYLLSIRGAEVTRG